MFIKQLIIENGDKIIRNIEFHKWINLIIDSTSKENQKESWNNIWKTTVIRLIDFCLWSDWKNIYSDTEFNTWEESKIEKFLKDNDILITLTLIEDIDNELSNKITIKRNFKSYKSKISEINWEQFTDNNKFNSRLLELIFDPNSNKPTFRQIISKNIRDEKNKLINTLKVLHSTTTSETYESLYLFWLWIDIPDDKIILQAQKNIEEWFQKRLRKNGTLENIEQSIVVIDRKIKKIEKEKEFLNLDPLYKEELDNLNKIKLKINSISSEISRLEIQISLIKESETELKQEILDLDLKKIHLLYSKANSFIPNLQKSFEDVYKFHNNMVNERLNFITDELPYLEKQYFDFNKELNNLIINETDISENIRRKWVMENQENLIIELTKLYEQKGALEKQKDFWTESNQKLIKINNDIDIINESIQWKDEFIKKRIEKFNEFFSDVSYELYWESFILSSSRNERALELNITNLLWNLWTGKKKWQITAFDLAYIQFCDFLNIRCLHFILYDQIENIHWNQIYSILTRLVNKVNCQYIAPVLRDKLPDNINISDYEILELSENNKLFKI